MGEWPTVERDLRLQLDDSDIVAYLLKRLMTALTGAGEDSWKIAIPIVLTERVFETLFPNGEKSRLSGTPLLMALEEKGILSRGEERTRYVVHTDIREALLSYIQKKFTQPTQYWLDAPEILAVHTTLTTYYENQLSQGSATPLEASLEFDARKIDPEFLRMAYHRFMTLTGFERKCPMGIDRIGYWECIARSLPYFAMVFAGWITENFDHLDGALLKEFAKICAEEEQLLMERKLFTEEAASQLRYLARQGKFRPPVSRKGHYFKNLYETFEKTSEDAMLGVLYGVLLQGEEERIERYYKEEIEGNPTDADLLGSYAIFWQEMGDSYGDTPQPQACQGPSCGKSLPAFLTHVDSPYAEAEKYYQRAIAANPRHSANLGNYAIFLHYTRKDDDQAEEYYRKAIEVDPANARALGFYAVLLQYTREDYDQAEMCYREAIAADPLDAFTLGNYAKFLGDIRQDYDQAEIYYRRSIEGDPNNDRILWNYAQLLETIRYDKEQADHYYRRAIELNPKSVRNLACYATFLQYNYKDYTQAEAYYKQALQIDPQDNYTLRNYAVFLHYTGKDYEHAEKYYQQALEIEPNNAYALGNYAIFLEKIRHDYDTAESFFKKSIAIDPHDTYRLEKYAQFLANIRHDPGQAEEFYQQALAAKPNDEHIFFDYAVFLDQIRQDYERAAAYYEHAITTNPDNPISLGNCARLLFLQGDSIKGQQYLNQAFDRITTDEQDLLLELWFYRYAHLPEWREKALEPIQHLLKNGVRSLEWDLHATVERAITDGHPKPELLRTLADVITKNASVETLRFWKT